MSKRHLLDQVLELPVDERARMARKIIASLDGPAEDGAEEAWIREIERRAQEVRDGSVKLLDWKEARKRIVRRLTENP